MSFRALLLEEKDGKVSGALTALDEAKLPAGDVTVSIDYTTLNYKDGLILANKARLCLFSSSEALRDLGVDARDATLLREIVPETLPFATLGKERAWRERRDWVFKPCAAFGSRAVYRGDKVSRRKLDEIAADPESLAQRRVEPGTVEVETLEGTQAMKFDVRAYAYRDEVLLLGARVYQGQVTNLRSPGGGFSGICVSREPRDAD